MIQTMEMNCYKLPSEPGAELDLQLPVPAAGQAERCTRGNTFYPSRDNQVNMKANFILQVILACATLPLQLLLAAEAP